MLHAQLSTRITIHEGANHLSDSAITIVSFLDIGVEITAFRRSIHQTFITIFGNIEILIDRAAMKFYFQNFIFRLIAD